jgi:hypothetical protein
MNMTEKVYVAVETAFNVAGKMSPIALEWEGKRYEIDRLLGVQPAHASKTGGQGDRYTVIINGKQRHLYFEHAANYGDTNLGRWFIERQ